jgi:hypothetical protein
MDLSTGGLAWFDWFGCFWSVVVVGMVVGWLAGWLDA